MHLTLKLATTRPPRQTLVLQQECFDNFQNIFNFERPHEGIKNKYPSEIYKKSDKEYKKLERCFLVILNMKHREMLGNKIN